MKKFVKTRKLLHELETMKFDYGKCVQREIDVIKTMMGESGDSGMSAQFVTLGMLKYTHYDVQPFFTFGMGDLVTMPEYGCKKILEHIGSSRKWIVKEAKKNLKKYTNPNNRNRDTWKTIIGLDKKYKEDAAFGWAMFSIFYYADD